MAHINRILVPTDFSACSRAALDVACELSSRLDVPLTIMHAYGIPAYPLPEGVILATPEQTAEIISHSSQALHQELDRAKALGATGADSVMVEGDAFDAIEQVVRERQIDLLIMGTHGRRGLAHALLGSVAEKIVRRGPCSVLTVRAPS
ncbi:MAG: universal stress protein [Myxococcales bacterium]|nr:universal stress protein [Myxococcales bacterium]